VLRAGFEPAVSRLRAWRVIRFLQRSMIGCEQLACRAVGVPWLTRCVAWDSNPEPLA
jgi:hypothetical protein